MRLLPRIFVLIFVFVATAVLPMTSQSVFPMRPDDAHAVYLEPGSFGAAVNGNGDDTAAIQAATTPGRTTP